MKQLGQSNIQVSELIVGGNVFGWTLDEKSSFEILDIWLENGINTIDTADTYSHWGEGNIGGESETILGKWMKERNNRSEVIIATKFGGSYHENPSRNISASYARKAIQRSLDRLQTDYIDLYQVHHDDENTPVEETINVLNEFIDKGWVKAIGVSNMKPERIIASLEYAEKNNLKGYSSLQPEYNLVAREKFEKSFLPIAEKYSLGVIPYFALASGFLSGKYKNSDDIKQTSNARKKFLAEYDSSENWEILKRLNQLSEKKNIPISTLSIAWLMQQKQITAPIVSATSMTQINELLLAKQIDFPINVID